MDLQFFHGPLLTLQIDLAVRIAAAALLGGLIGLERSLAGKHAGMRTYALVGMGSALFVVIGVAVQILYNSTGLDPTRIAGSVMIGIGFIGSGLAFLRATGDMRGLDAGPGELTTAAGIWVAAAVGVACGFGLYVLAILAALLTIIIFTLLMGVERSVERKFRDRGVQNLE
jgi:putative Mg2+ transporter-C (MgtC) family protein